MSCAPLPRPAACLTGLLLLLSSLPATPLAAPVTLRGRLRYSGRSQPLACTGPRAGPAPASLLTLGPEPLHPPLRSTPQGWFAPSVGSDISPSFLGTPSVPTSCANADKIRCDSQDHTWSSPMQGITHRLRLARTLRLPSLVSLTASSHPRPRLSNTSLNFAGILLGSYCTAHIAVRGKHDDVFHPQRSATRSALPRSAVALSSHIPSTLLVCSLPEYTHTDLGRAAVLISIMSRNYCLRSCATTRPGFQSIPRSSFFACALISGPR